eukprot:769453-Amphidinium_carterae.1
MPCSLGGPSAACVTASHNANPHCQQRYGSAHQGPPWLWHVSLMALEREQSGFSTPMQWESVLVGLIGRAARVPLLTA